MRVTMSRRTVLPLPIVYAFAIATFLVFNQRTANAAEPTQLTDDQVVKFANLALQGIPREYPNKPSNVMADAASVLSPKEMHPVFFGSFDWHSSLHGHWMLIRLAKLYPQASVTPQIRELLDRQLTKAKLQKEADYFKSKWARSFERMYGWAWTMRMAAELHSWDDPDAKRWAKNFGPLEKQIVSMTEAYLPRLTYPIRTGVHPDTGFALAQALDYARSVGNDSLESLVVDFVKRKYIPDQDYSARFEPSGEDFFSTALNEADLVRRILSPNEFNDWLQRFLPGLDDPSSESASLLQPATVSDLTDPKIVHLVGLNLSRAWTLQGIRDGLPKDAKALPAIKRSIEDHRKAGLQYVFSGHYEGEHWLATFAVYMLTEAGSSP